MDDGKPRCSWCEASDLYRQYHDQEWGRPLHDERRLFEMLVLEGAQAGLSWITILNKRENYRRAFHRFDPGKIARYGERDRARLLADAGIVRNRLKIEAAIVNARSYLALCESGTTLDAFLWDFVDGRPIVRRSRAKAPARTQLSDAVSKALSARGFKFVGSTIVYAYLQAVGVVNDHAPGCWCHPRHQG